MWKYHYDVITNIIRTDINNPIRTYVHSNAYTINTYMREMHMGLGTRTH